MARCRDAARPATAASQPFAPHEREPSRNRSTTRRDIDPKTVITDEYRNTSMIRTLREHCRVNTMPSSLEVAEIAVEVKGKLHFGPPKTKAGRRTVPLPAASTNS